MPPIDPSIPLRAVQPRKRDRDPMRDYANMLQISEFQDKRDKRNAFEQAAQGAVGPDGKLDYGALESGLARSGNVEGAMKVGSMISQRKKAELDAETAQFNQFKQRLDLTGRIVAGVNDQASWDRARASFGRFGLNGESLPEQYDPAVVDQLRNEALTAKEQLDRVMEERKFGLDERRTAASQKKADAAAAGKLGSTVNVLPEAPQDAFLEKGAEIEAKNFSAMLEAGDKASRELAQLNQLEDRLKDVESGGWARAKQILGNLGINTDGLSDIQAAEAMINQLIPGQRPPGSGEISDMDLQMYKQSLARLINQPGGNQKIIDGIRAIKEYDQKIGQISAKAFAGEITRAQARDQINALGNPTSGLLGTDTLEKERNARESSDNIPTPATAAEAARLPPGTTFRTPDGRLKVRP